MGSTRVNFRLPEELVQKADIAAEVDKTNRTEVIKRALLAYFEEVETDKGFKEAVVDLYLDNEIGFDVLKLVLGRQDAESVRASKALLADDGDLADDLVELP